MPIPGVGYPRLTAPFATSPTAVLLQQWDSFDLHAYSTPPTFVLSQDQTLQKLLLVPEARGPRRIIPFRGASKPHGG